MTTTKYFIATILTLTLSLSSVAQTVEKTFSGWWADTWWTFDFYRDTTYKRVSSGHYGSTEVKGNYKINKDTIQIISGFKTTHGTINEFYLLDNDSFLIDLSLMYDYRLTNDRNSVSYFSRKRYDILKKRNQDSITYKSAKEFDSLIVFAIGLLKTKNFWQITDEENMLIMKLRNTILMTNVSNQKKRFIDGIYTDFNNLIQQKKYEKNASEYYDWVPNRGMGFYFQKLQVELGGTPHFYSRFIVK